jgi:hypothetical protein
MSNENTPPDVVLELLSKVPEASKALMKAPTRGSDLVDVEVVVL